MAVAFVLASLHAATVTTSVAASSATTSVSASVPTATRLSVAGCPDAALAFGTLTVGSSQVSGACDIEFGANVSARLVAFQDDASGTALESVTGPWTERRGGSVYTSTAIGSASSAWIGVNPGVGTTVRLLHSADGGSTWDEQVPCGLSSVSTIEALNGSEALIGTGSRICRTTDAGATWIGVLSGVSIRDLDMVDSLVGWALSSGGSVYRTLDGGLTWTLRGTVTGAGGWADLSAVSSTVAYVNGTKTLSPTHKQLVVTATSDGGTSWTTPVVYRELIPGLGAATIAIQAVTATDVVVAGSGGVYRSTDSGATWTQVSTRLIRAFARVSATEYVAAIDTDRYIRTTDSGATWGPPVELGNGSEAYLQDIAVRGSDMYVVGMGEIAVHSTDGGSTFIDALPPRSDLSAVVAWDAERFVVGGTMGHAFLTTDGGVTISQSVVGSGADLVDGVVVGDGIGVMVGADGTILRTTNHGATWSTIASPIATSYDSVVRDGDTLWAAAASGRIAQSTNGGTSWSEVAAIPGGATATALTARDGVVWVGSTLGRVYRSTDAGATWSLRTTGATGTVEAAWAFDATSAIFSVNGLQEGDLTAKFVRTTDSGTTWSSQPVITDVTGGRLGDIAFSGDGRVGIALSSDYAGSVRSTDGGQTWTNRETASMSTERFARLSSGRMIVVGYNEDITVMTPAADVPDGIPASGPGFGACLEQAPGAASVSWAVVGVGNCTVADPAMWQAIARTSSGPTARVAGTASGADATVRLRFGVRMAANQTAGDYAAEVGFGVVAPDV